ncbi:MAG: ABC transporter, partial [Oscillospiraceae bacterium]
RLLIARALAVEPKILMLDEPTASVDPASKEQIYELLSEINKKITVILVTHDLMTIASNVKRIVCINRGVVYHGEPHLTEKVLTELYGCPVDIVAHGVPHRVLDCHDGGDC